MNNQLTEFVDAEISVAGLKSPVDEAKIAETLKPIAGIDEFRINGDRVDLRYDPTFITKKEIAEKIQAAGFGVAEVEAAPSSPIVDALETKPAVCVDDPGPAHLRPLGGSKSG